MIQKSIRYTPYKENFCRRNEDKLDFIFEKRTWSTLAVDLKLIRTWQTTIETASTKDRQKSVSKKKLECGLNQLAEYGQKHGVHFTEESVDIPEERIVSHYERVRRRSSRMTFM